jgi:hypothetical protein
MMCLAVAVDVMGLVIMAVTIGVIGLAMLVVFVWYLHSRDKLFTQTIKGIEHSCHDFQRQLNDNTREAFKSILVTLNDTKHALNTSAEVTLQAMTLMGQLREEMRERGQRPPDRGSHI